MPESMLTAFCVVFLFWPKAGQRIDGWCLGGAFFLAAPLGWILLQTHLVFVGLALMSFAAWVMARWLRDKWRSQ